MTAHVHKTWAQSFCSGTNQSDRKIIIKIIINIQYQINGAQLDNDVCTLGEKLWWLPKKPKCFLDRPDGSENTRLQNKLVHAPVETRGPGVLVQQILEFFLGLGFLTSLMTPNGKIKFVSPIWDIYKKKFLSKFSPFLGEKIVNLIILCCGNTYGCVLVYSVTLISVCVDLRQLVYQ